LKKISKKILIKRLDNECMALWGEIIHRSNKCALCGNTNCRLEAHHIWHRGTHFAVKHYVPNGILLCFRCHKVKTHAEGCQDLGLWLKNKYGEEWYNELKRKAKTIVPDKLAHLIEARDLLQKELGYE
jgi:hypothetical protein